MDAQPFHRCLFVLGLGFQFAEDKTPPSISPSSSPFLFFSHSLWTRASNPIKETLPVLSFDRNVSCLTREGDTSTVRRPVFVGSMRFHQLENPSGWLQQFDSIDFRFLSVSPNIVMTIKTNKHHFRRPIVPCIVISKRVGLNWSVTLASILSSDYVLPITSSCYEVCDEKIASTLNRHFRWMKPSPLLCGIDWFFVRHWHCKLVTIGIYEANE